MPAQPARHLNDDRHERRHPHPRAWTKPPFVTVAVSVDGLAKDHNLRRKPATYEKILKNITDTKVNIHWTVVNQRMQQPGYLDQCVSFWNARPEINKIWMSLYTPQRGEVSPEIFPPPAASAWPAKISALSRRYPKLLVPDGMAKAFLVPPTPTAPSAAVLMSAALHWIGGVRALGPRRLKHLVQIEQP